MFGPMGASFVPTNEAAMMGPQRGQNEGVQQALKVLSLRLPQAPSSPIAPMNLLMQGGRDFDTIQQLLSMIQRSQAPQTPGMPELPTPQAPSPFFQMQQRRPSGFNLPTPAATPPATWWKQPSAESDMYPFG